MRSSLFAFLAIAFTSVALGDPVKPHYNLASMTPEEIDRAVVGHPRYDFDLASIDGVVDAAGKLIRPAELPDYLRSHAIEPDAFVFLWIRPESAPLDQIAPTVKPFGDYGLTQIVVRHRPEAVNRNRTTGDARFAGVRAELLEIHKTDQQYRLQLDALDKAGNSTSPERPALLQQMREADALNVPKVEAILTQYGWLGPSDIGDKANGVLFLVVQHSSAAIQRKYLPLMREAVKAGQARGASLALLEDRVALGEGRPQVYGSQLRREGNGPLFIQAIDDPDHVDERRASVGLPSMAEYVNHWNLTWDLEAYKKELPQLLEKLAVQRAAYLRTSAQDEK